MNGTATRFLRLGVSLAGLVTLGWVLTGQAAKPVRHAVPTDWSHHHLIFSNPHSAERAARVSKDPRYLQQVYRRQQRLALPSALSAAADALQSAVRPRSRLKVMSEKMKRDWSRDLGSTGTVGAGNYPAKFSFDITTAFCNAAPTPDYAVFSTGLPGSLTQASVVAYDNLYNGCGGPTPLVYWAYNTGGTIRTSPVLSLDGSQVAFVQTLGGVGTLVTLKWKAADGTVALPSVPTVVPSMSACIATPCMTLTLLRDGQGFQTNDITSSVFYDYKDDIGWVGGSAGWLHKITGLFKGIPAEVTTGGFPVQVNAGSVLSSPVYDGVTNNVFVGDVGGLLHRVDAANGTVVTSAPLDFGTGIVEGPIVDSGNAFVYVFASSDGTTNCPGPAACSAVYQLSTTFGGGSSGTKVTVGASSGSPNPLYIGGFDSAYYDSVAATGNLYVCGNTGGPATLYQVPIQAGALPVAGSPITALATPASTAACSPVTDVPNEFLPGGFSERAFVSVQNNGLSSSCGSAGCVMNFVTAPWFPFTSYAVGQQVLSSQQHVETVKTAGISAGGPPTWSTQPAATVTDGNIATEVVWIDQGSFSSPFLPWTASNTYVTPLIKILDPVGNVQVLTTPGTTGPSQPAWNPTPGLTTADNTAVWTNAGALGTAALPAAGGTSGIIIDNMLAAINSSPGSQIYFSTLSDQVCGTSGTGGCAVQASQPALQ